MSLFVHAGYAKAGSTFLQERVFAPHERLNYLGKSRAEYPDWLIRWHYADDLYFDRHATEIRTHIDSLCEPDVPNLLSSEMFTMHGGSASAQLRRLHRIVPDARVILVLRDPIDRLISFYRHLVEHDGLTLPLEECLDWERTPFVFYKRKVAYLADSLYDELVDFAHEQFDNRVCVLRFEDLVERPEEFLGELERFVGVPFDAPMIQSRLPQRENAGVAATEIPRLRWENAVSALKPLAPDALIPAPTGSPRVAEVELVSEELRENLRDFYRGRCQGYY